MKKVVKHLYLLLMVATLAAAQEAAAAPETTSGTAAKPAPKAIPLAGKVLETVDGGGYTYVLLQNGYEKVWVAVPLMKVKAGQEVAFVPGFEMKNFTSKGLNKKFDRVIFSAGVANQEIKLSPAALKMAHKGMQTAPEKAPAPKASSSISAEKRAAISLERIAKAKGKNAYTIAQLYAKKSKLEKKPIVVRGKVVKVSAHILKRNWVHIQDGSGSAAKKTNNLIITTKDMPNVGDVVTVKGTLYNNMDFGSGYRYGVLVEGATLVN